MIASLRDFLKNANISKKYDNLLDYPIIQLDLNAEVTPSDLNAKVTPSDLNAEVTPSDLNAVATPSDLKAEVTPSDLKAEVTPSDLKAEVTLSDLNAEVPLVEPTQNVKKPINPILSISAIDDKHTKKKKRQINNKLSVKFIDEDLINFVSQNPIPKPQNSIFKTPNSTKFMIKEKDSPYYGIIIDSTTLRPLSIPPPPSLLISSKNAKKINSLLEKKVYDIIKIEDGTIITLYSWIHPQNGIMWSIASNNGYDISSYKWMGKLTYAEIFYDLVDRLYPDFKKQTGMDILYIAHTDDIKTILTFANLDPNYCYTMGFRHHNFHPMKVDGEKIWQVQYVNLLDEDYTIINGGLFTSLPIQEKCDYSSIGKEPINLETIELKCRSSFTNAYLYINKNYIEGEQNYIEDDQSNEFSPQYGYILKYRSQTIIIKSPLLKIIEKFIYKYHKDYKIYSENLNYLNRMNYIAMRAFLKNGKGDLLTSYRQQFILLFPEWSSKFADFNKLTSSLIDKITYLFVAAKKHNATTTTTATATKKTVTTTTKKTVMDNLVYKLYKLIKKDYNLTENYEEVIHDYVHNPEYAFIYINIDV